MGLGFGARADLGFWVQGLVSLVQSSLGGSLLLVRACNPMCN